MSLESGLVFAYLFDTEAILHAYDNQKADIKLYSWRELEVLIDISIGL